MDKREKSSRFYAASHASRDELIEVHDTKTGRVACRAHPAYAEKIAEALNTEGLALMPGVGVGELEWEGERAEVGLPGWSYSTHHFAELGKWGAFCWLDGSMYVLGSDDWTEQANFDAEHEARSACQRDLYQRLSSLQPAGELVEAARESARLAYMQAYQDACEDAGRPYCREAATEGWGQYAESTAALSTIKGRADAE
ncbi:hypothetical protein [Marinicauda sp. Alg238-R41]|uniref:hypothetical protein n=1 Tax=Marinicauda sp. Alg238-R41 TaxID=2993447 RepID=UPI0022E2C4F2|nr:hypothetical protein [Marinicauda sp. Alg238-R41]